MKTQYFAPVTTFAAAILTVAVDAAVGRTPQITDPQELLDKFYSIIEQGSVPQDALHGTRSWAEC